MFAARSSADTCRWDLPLPKALALTRGYLKSDPLVLALLRLRPLALVLCRSARKSSWTGKETLLFLCFYLENNKGKLTSWCELPLEHLLSLDRSVLAHSRLR